jgi:N-acetylglucosamine malate deacetylase 1
MAPQRVKGKRSTTAQPRVASQSQPGVMAVGAHHDDNELVAGTLARLRDAGWRLLSVVLTDGVWIHGKVAPEHVAIRERESRAAARRLGMECVFLRFPEGNFHATVETQLALVEQIRRFRPALLITHPPHDYHLDHMQTSQCAYEAVHVCANPTVQTASEPCPRPMLYYADAWFVPFEPDEYVDIGEQVALKRRVLGCHTSQLPPPRSGQDSMIDLAILQNRIRGVEAGVRYAEAFRLQPFAGAGRLRRLLP